MKTAASLAAAFVMLLAATGCDKKPDAAPTNATNDLRAPTEIGRTGIPDDSIKPKPVINVTKTGTADDGVKPLVPITKSGVPDDSVKPVKPVVQPPVKPVPTPR